MATLIDPRGTRDLSSGVIDAQGRLRVMPAAYYRDTTIMERALLGARHALYGLPTSELVAWIKDFIGARSAIEIGAGNGVLAAALGIPGTDSHMQARADIAQLYAAAGQKVIDYGAHVFRLDAAEALAIYTPQVVVASWVTHQWREEREGAGGNMWGVVEEDIIDAVDAYIFIGNDKVHAGKSIWSRPHTKITPDWLFSRAHNGSPDFIAVWGA